MTYILYHFLNCTIQTFQKIKYNIYVYLLRFVRYKRFYVKKVMIDLGNHGHEMKYLTINSYCKNFPYGEDSNAIKVFS